MKKDEVQVTVLPHAYLNVADQQQKIIKKTTKTNEKSFFERRI